MNQTGNKRHTDKIDQNIKGTLRHYNILPL